MRGLILACLLAVTPALAAAQEVIPCDWQASARNIAEPWEANTQTFANGAIRVAVLDTIEPAAAAFYLLVISPPYDELGIPQCGVVSAGAGMGFGGLSLDGVEAGYDPAEGLVLTLAAQTYSEEGQPTPATLRVTINQASGQIIGQLD